jgi:coenzyme F420-0:L-glutamate ligase / coenzyme F420-1:gamma-L-glutamate ligase
VTPSRLEITALEDFPLVEPEDDITQLLIGRAPNDGYRDGDILIIAQKIISKAESRFADLKSVSPSKEAETLAAETEKDPRLVELILSESTEIARHRPGVIIAVHRLGFVLANAGIDASNVGRDDDHVLLLPVNPDQTCRDIRKRIHAETGAQVATIINDSLGRAWRHGTMGIALGAAGLPALLDLRQKPDLHGRTLQVSIVGLADELAAAGSLVQGQGAEGRPVALVRGFNPFDQDFPASDLVRPAGEDLFR